MVMFTQPLPPKKLTNVIYNYDSFTCMSLRCRLGCRRCSGTCKGCWPYWSRGCSRCSWCSWCHWRCWGHWCSWRCRGHRRSWGHWCGRVIIRRRQTGRRVATWCGLLIHGRGRRVEAFVGIHFFDSLKVH